MQVKSERLYQFARELAAINGSATITSEPRPHTTDCAYYWARCWPPLSAYGGCEDESDDSDDDEDEFPDCECCLRCYDNDCSDQVIRRYMWYHCHSAWLNQQGSNIDYCSSPWSAVAITRPLLNWLNDGVTLTKEKYQHLLDTCGPASPDAVEYIIHRLNGEYGINEHYIDNWEKLKAKL